MPATIRTTCPSDEDLAMFAGDVADGAVARHVAVCASCARVVDVVRSSSTLDARPPVAGADLDDPAAGDGIGRYVVLRRLGRGGMGLVLHAYDPVLDRMVAIKLIRADRASPEHARSLEREARSLARLAHPNVVRVFDAGTWAGRVFLAMEYVEGETVRGWLAAAPRTTDEILRVFIAAARGLAATHAAGLVHRDVKPDNILVGADGVARLADFGLVVAGATAGEIDGAAPAGTPAYMAPEQRAGGTVDARSDQWSFCAALRESLGDDRRIPRRIRAALDRGTAHAPAARFPDVDALIAAIEPRRSRIPALTLVAVAATVTVIVWARGPGGADDACARRGGVGAARWSDAARDRVRAAFAATGHPRAEARFATTSAMIEGHLGAWGDAATELCRKERASGRSTGRERACLERRLDEASALIAALARIDRVGVDQAPLAVGRSTPLEWCLDVRALAGAPDRPDDEVLRAQVDAIRAEHGRLRAEMELGRFADLRAPVDALVERARVAGDPQVLGEAALLRGEVLLRLRDDRGAEAALADAALAAAQARDDRTAARARLLEARAVAADRARLELAARLAEIAAAAVERAGAPGELAAERDLLRGSLRYLAGDAAGAERAWRDALAILTATFGAAHPRAAQARVNLSMALHRQRRLAEAAREAEAAVELLEQSLGPGHLEGAAALVRLATISVEEDRLDDAARLHREALARYRDGLGPEHLQVASAHANLGGVELMRGELAAAVVELERAVAIRERLQGADAPELAIPLTTLAVALIRLDRWAEATARLEHARRLDASGSPESMAARLLALARARHGMSDVELARSLASILEHRGAH